MNILKTAFSIRGYVMRKLKPVSSYGLVNNSLRPLSSKFGFDRGKPIDRYWIEDFLKKNEKLIKGKCLEVTDNYYTRKFGKSKVVKSDVLDVNKKNKKANIYGDLKNLNNVVKDNTYNCVVLTHVLGLIDEPSRALDEIYRILKPGGSLIITSSCFSPTYGEAINYWRFTPSGMKYLLKQNFDTKDVKVKSYGNVLAGQSFWVGMSQEDVDLNVLEFNDRRYPCIVAATARK